MKCGKLTAKLRDAVPVRFYENGREIKRFKNIEIPDAIKELEFTGFKFDVPESGPITFKIFFKAGTLPEIWPEARQRKTRTPKAAEPEPVPPDPVQDAVAALTDAMEQAREEGQPVDEIARRSVNLLLDMMETDAAPRHILVEASFRRRESVAQCTRA